MGNFSGLVYCHFYGFKEFSAQTKLASLVPSVGVFNVRGSSRAKERWLHLGRERICVKISSQGIPSGPERSRSSKRRSNSSRCVSVSGTLPGCLLRLSQSSSIILSRSAGLRSSILMAGLLMRAIMLPSEFLCYSRCSITQAGLDAIRRPIQNMLG